MPNQNTKMMDRVYGPCHPIVQAAIADIFLTLEPYQETTAGRVCDELQRRNIDLYLCKCGEFLGLFEWLFFQRIIDLRTEQIDRDRSLVYYVKKDHNSITRWRNAIDV